MGLHEAEQPLLIPFSFLGFSNAINPVTLSFAAFLLCFALLAIAARRKEEIPRGILSFVELIFEFIEGLSKPLLGAEQSARFFPLFLMLFLYIFFANLLGLIPGLLSPTSRADINAAMAVVVFVTIHVAGIAQKGVRGYFAHFLPPKLPLPPKGMLRGLLLFIQAAMVPLMVTIHLIGELAKPLSLTMRLFGNIMAKEKLLAVLVLLVILFWPISAFTKVLAFFPVLLRPLIIVLGVFVSFVQALVFTLLAVVYVAGALHSEEHEDAAHHAAA